MHDAKEGTEHSYVFPDKKDWGISKERLFKHSLEFYKKIAKLSPLSYHDQVNLASYHKQAMFGPFDQSKASSLGFFDFVGHDRRNRWKDLTSISQEQARLVFTKLLREHLNAQFDAWVESLTMKEASAGENTDLSPNDTCAHQDLASSSETPNICADVGVGGTCEKGVLTSAVEASNKEQLPFLSKAIMPTSPGVIMNVCPPTLVYRKDIWEFKETCRKHPGCVFTVPRGELVSLRVPTQQQGSCLVWELATDNYDIGMQVTFEWGGSNQKNPLMGTPGNLAGNGCQMTMEIVRLQRCNTNELVHVGQHKYPCHGTYTILLDNSYSYLRSKKVYYRIHYSCD